MKIIPTSIHGILDYVVGLALLAAPYLFNFAEVGGAAVATPQILGIGLIIYSLLTKYELGLIKIIPVSVHLMLDYIAAIFLALSPWIFGFADNALNVWLPHVVVGIVVVLVVYMTQNQSRNV